jgi:hypothetical protein
MTDLQRTRRVSTLKSKPIGANGRTIVTTRTIGPIEQAMIDATANIAQMTSDEWCTGPEIATPLLDLWDGPADCDPCSNERSIVKAVTKYCEGGLILPWKRKTYQNHPYSTNEPWVAKAIREMQVGRVRELVILCMTATSTRWWQRLMIEPKRNPRVITTKRLKFIGPSGKPMDSSRFEPALIYYGKRTKQFDREFRHVAMWSTWGR